MNTGQAWGASLGFYSFKARMYHPTLGRFLQTDPTGYGDGLNWYAYVGNDPLNRSDPTGMWLMDDGSQGGWLLGGPGGGASNGGGSAVSQGGQSLLSFAKSAIMAPVRALQNIIYGPPGNGPSGMGNLSDWAVLGTTIATIPLGQVEASTVVDEVVVTASRAGRPEAPAFASSPIGRKGNPLDVAPGTNSDGYVRGVEYGGHAFDQMQGRGVPPSVVENALRTGRMTLDPIPGRLRFYDSANNLTVVTETNGRVVTVVTGRR